MKPCEAIRVAKKIVPKLNRYPEQRVALETLIGLVQSAHDDVQRDRQAEFRRFLDQLEEPA